MAAPQHAKVTGTEGGLRTPGRDALTDGRPDIGGTRELGRWTGAARPAALPVQAEGAVPPVEQAEQQQRGPRQRGVPRRQVLAEGRHGTTESERAGAGARRGRL